VAISGEEGEGAMRPWARERPPGPGSARRDAGSTATRKPAIRKRRGRARSRRFAIRSMYQKSIGGRKVKRREGGGAAVPEVERPPRLSVQSGIAEYGSALLAHSVCGYFAFSVSLARRSALASWV